MNQPQIPSDEDIKTQLLLQDEHNQKLQSKFRKNSFILEVDYILRTEYFSNRRIGMEDYLKFKHVDLHQVLKADWFAYPGKMPLPVANTPWNKEASKVNLDIAQKFLPHPTQQGNLTAIFCKEGSWNMPEYTARYIALFQTHDLTDS